MPIHNHQPTAASEEVGHLLDRAAVLLSLLILSYTAFLGWHTWQQTRSDKVQELETVVEMGQKALDNYLWLMQLSVQELGQDVQGRSGAELERPVRRYMAVHPEALDVTVIRKDGQMLYSTAAAQNARLPSLHDRPPFLASVEAMHKGTNFILDRPILGTLTHTWTLPLRQSIRGANGELEAMVVVYLPQQVLHGFWENAPISRNATLGLLGDDAFLRARYPMPASVNLDEAYGTPRRGFLYQNLQAAGFPASGATDGPNPFGKGLNFTVFHRLQRYPVTLFASVPKSVLEDTWWTKMQANLLLVVVLLAGLWLVYWQTRRRQGELHRVQQASRTTQARLAAIVESSDDAILSRSMDGVLTSWNPGARRLLGFQAAEAIGQSVDLIVPPEHQGDEHLLMTQVHEGGRVDRVETQRLHRSGTRVDVEMSVAPLLDDEGELSGVSYIMRDITARKRAEQAIHRLAYFDALTGLPNRRQLLDRLQLALAGATNAASVGALIFIDLDHFKDVNDARGHAVGDEVLRQAAGKLLSLAGEGQLVARLGGDEFVILAPSLAQDAEGGALAALALAENARQLLGEPLELQGNLYAHSASLGISMFPQGQRGPDDLLREADTAMYRAKAAGRNRVAFFEAHMQSDIEDRMALENDLAQAIVHDQLEIHLQVQIGTLGQPDGAELLLRWKHPSRGFVPPVRFIPVAEKSGLILGLGDWVLQQCCELLARLDQHDLNMPLSINVSPRQFRQPEFVARVREILRATGARADRLILEVTEGLLIDDMEETVARMHELAQMGVRFSIDDFGTGYSSLAYLKRLPLYELKIDRSFVQDTPTDANDTAIVQLILSMAQNLGLRVVAEGVETTEQADFLRASGCDAMQGYLFARPMNAWHWLHQQVSTGAQ
jgi:diguanylate cyclase (GGDEF)-like protein/PAS domain S-box-containing protein